MPDEAPSEGQVRAALEELLGWQGISRSPQLAELLKYVVQRTLAGDEGSIKAYSIAVDVFGRPPTFDPQADPIVRVQARRLRTLLEQYYDSGSAESAVQIHLPLGRYVPEFSFARAREGAAAATEQAKFAEVAVARASPPTRRPAGFALTAVLGFCFTLVGVALAVFIIRWTPVGAPAPAVAELPEPPQISVGAFDNLTGDNSLDGAIANIGPSLAQALGKFEQLQVTSAPAPGGLVLSGGVQKSGSRFDVRVMLSEGEGTGTVWTTTVSNNPVSDIGTLDDVTAQIVPQLAGSRGPLHAGGRSWLMAQKGLPANPNLYVCQLQFMIWRDSRRAEDALSGTDCFAKILAATPDNAVALAGHAALKAWWVQHEAKPDDNLAALLTEETSEAARAVSLQPGSSFVNEMQGTVLARQDAIAAASGAYERALELNPENMDAAASYGLRLWLNGQFDKGSALGERALTATASPPPWYYQTRAFDAMREARYFDALDAAQALAAADNEYGPVTALAAAPQVGRNDLIDRYRPMVLNNTHFQSVGILPRLGILIKQQVLLDRLKQGLTLAGVPPEAIIGPFRADGKPAAG